MNTRKALGAFGKYSFFHWFQWQYDSPMAGEMHGRFLLDTLQFLEKGRRSMCLENWSALITIDHSGSGIGKLPPEAREFFAIGKSYGRDVDLASILQLWNSHPSGFEDLLGSLHILFGAPDVR